jgi:hypothetical protein
MPVLHGPMLSVKISRASIPCFPNQINQNPDSSWLWSIYWSTQGSFHLSMEAIPDGDSHISNPITRHAGLRLHDLGDTRPDPLQLCHNFPPNFVLRFFALLAGHEWTRLLDLTFTQIFSVAFPSSLRCTVC